MAIRTLALPSSIASILSRHVYIPQATASSSSLETSSLPAPDTDGMVHLPVGAGPTGGSPGLQDCIACGLRHVDPDYVNLCLIPREMIQEMVSSVVDPLDLHRAASVSSTFKELVTSVLYARLTASLVEKGFSDPRGFLKFIYRHKIYIAGPGLLPILFPDCPRIPEFETRVELHSPDCATSVTELTAVLLGDGFKSSDVYEGRVCLLGLFNNDLRYPHFGRTVKKVLRFTKDRAAGGERIVVLVFISSSAQTGFLSVVEYPTTLFMIAVDGISLHIVYPALTGIRRGLINMPFPKTLVSFHTPPFFNALQPFFDLQENLISWPEFRFHICDQNASCPLRVRCLSDNRSIILPCSVDHPFMRMRQDPFVAWMLRCAGSCMNNMPFPDQEVHYKGRYIASDLHVADA
ncbi:hypothetical protein H1R20_g12526, partial [Candolleomyces eurysporus]